MSEDLKLNQEEDWGWIKVVSSEDIKKISKKLGEHEKRIGNLEKIIKGRKKKVLTERKTILDHLTYLKSEGFFDEPRVIREIVNILAQEGYHYPPESLTYPLQRAVQQRILGRTKVGKLWGYCKR